MSCPEGPVYDLCIVGAGMVGSSAARHATSREGVKVCLIGPQEPQVRRCVTGYEIFGAHYDSGRITHTAPTFSRVWSVLSERSLQRVRETENLSGIHFFENVGCCYIGEKYVNQVESYRSQTGNAYPYLNTYDLCAKLPYMSLSNRDAAVVDPIGGWLDPRKFVSAQQIIALHNGCDILRDVVQKVYKVDLGAGHYIMNAETEAGHVIRARTVLLATNAFITSRDLMDGAVPKFTASPQTIVMGEVPEDKLEILRGMPSILYHSHGGPSWSTYPSDPDGKIHFYMVPPAQYPDGKYYIKIGHSDGILASFLDKKDISTWHCSGGDPKIAANLTKLLTEMFPSIKFKTFVSDSCVTMPTPTGRPYIDKVHKHLGVAIGGNGHGASSADEFGRVAVHMMLDSSWNYDIPMEEFRLVLDSRSNGPNSQSKL